MNNPLLAASILSFVTVFVHVLLGGAMIHKPMLASNASNLVRAVGSVVWHATTAMMLLNAVALLYASANTATSGPMVFLIIAQYLAATALFIFYGLKRFGSLIVMPHWAVFLAMSVLAIWGISGL